MKSDYSRHYARFHPETPEHEASMRALLRRWLEPHLPADREARILDVGCGRGYALGLLQELGFARIAGIDSSTGQVEFARRRGLPVTEVSDTVAWLENNRDRHDLILLMDVLEHVPVAQQPAFLQALAGALRPGGRLIATVPNAGSPLAAYWRYVDPTHHTAFTVHSLEHRLHEGGFEAESISSVEFAVRPKFLFWLPTRRSIRWWLLVLTRFWWRLVTIAELDWAQGRQIPLGPNLLAVARRR